MPMAHLPFCRKPRLIKETPIHNFVAWVFRVGFYIEPVQSLTMVNDVIWNALMKLSDAQTGYIILR